MPAERRSGRDRRRGPADPAPRGTRIGVLSDTHGCLDPAIPGLLTGVAHIIHAGDIMDAEELATLAGVAPVTAVAGNLDTSGPTSDLPREVCGEVQGVRFLVGHKRKRLFKRLAQGKVDGACGVADVDLIVFGHEHVPSAAWVDGVLHLNPGTATAPDDEDDGPTLAIVETTGTGLAVTFVPLRRNGESET